VPVTGRLAALALAAACAGGCRDEFAGRILEPRRAAPDVGALRFAEHRGEVVVLTFGFASCPDVCPLTLSRMEAAYAMLGADAGRVTMAFVGVDPERDGTEALREHVAIFDRRIVPVYVDRAALSRALDGYGAAATTRRRADGDVAVEHTTGMYVADRQGRLRLHHRHDARAEVLVADVRRLLAER
jgi:protein SCO1/2